MAIAPPDVDIVKQWSPVIGTAVAGFIVAALGYKWPKKEAATAATEAPVAVVSVADANAARLLREAVQSAAEMSERTFNRVDELSDDVRALRPTLRRIEDSLNDLSERTRTKANDHS